jgi:four helix bundle protein
VEDVRQLVALSGSVSANYIESNESLGKKGFSTHMNICRKEAKDSRLWRRLTNCGSKPDVELEHMRLIREAEKRARIFTAIV